MIDGPYFDAELYFLVTKVIRATNLDQCKRQQSYDDVVKAFISTMPGISTGDNIILIKYLKTRCKKKKIDLNARRFTRGFKDRKSVTHYLSKCQ